MNPTIAKAIVMLAVITFGVLIIPRSHVLPESPVALDHAIEDAGTANLAPSVIRPKANELSEEQYYEGELISEKGDFVVKQVHAINCRMLTRKTISDAGESFENVQHCDRVESYDHPYGQLTEDQLRSLAQSDGAAAFILAERLDKRLPHGSDIVVRLYIQALALSGEDQAFVALFDHMTGGAGIVKSENGIDIDHVANSFIWASIGDRLGYDTADEAERYASALIAAGLDLDVLDSQASQWASAIAKQRQTTTGEEF